MRKAFVFGSMILMVMSLASAVWAQSSTTGSIEGTVTDQTQNVTLPNVKITIVNDKTGAPRTVTTNRDGFFNAPNLPAGRYTLTTSATGFKQTVTKVELRSNENKVINLALKRTN